MPGPITPKIYKIQDLKYKLMQPALTSHFHCNFNPPSDVVKQLQSNGLFANQVVENLLISCSEANLPGSSFATNELNNDFTGVTQRHVYRRLYDDRADFTFYVDNSYSQIRIFEIWMRHIGGEQLSFDSQGTNKSISYRINYPKNYKTDIFISKFERNYGTKGGSNKVLTYTFVNAFPISINSMPVSYDSSQLLKCTVSFSYDRYFVDNVKDSVPPQEPAQPTAIGVPNPSNISYANGSVSKDAFTGNSSISGNYFNASPIRNNRQFNNVGANDLAGTTSTIA